MMKYVHDKKHTLFKHQNNKITYIVRCVCCWKVAEKCPSVFRSKYFAHAPIRNWRFHWLVVYISRLSIGPEEVAHSLGNTNIKDVYGLVHTMDNFVWTKTWTKICATSPDSIKVAQNTFWRTIFDSFVGLVAQGNSVPQCISGHKKGCTMYLSWERTHARTTDKSPRHKPFWPLASRAKNVVNEIENKNNM